MAKLCDMTKKEMKEEDEECKAMMVHLTENFSLLIHPQRRIDPGHAKQGVIAPEARKMIEDALAPLKAKLFAGKK